MPEDPADPSLDPIEDVTELMTPPTSGGPILPPSAAPLRETIGDFEVEAKLGAGGMGAVYRARQISLGRMVALKVLPAHMIEDAESVSRFQREARVAAGLSHANLVRVFSAGAADGVHYIAMELIEGEDLGRRLKREGRLPAPEALRICAEVARGLEYAWRTAHLIHRDIKPANIFLAAGGAVKVGDLGLAKSLLGNTTGLTQSGTMMGTPHYISPEQARADKEIDFRADIYSLGCTLYQMLAGQVPYAGTDPITIIRQHLDAPLPAILKVWPQCPVPLARLVGKMLKKSRYERHANYAELIAQIESVWAQLDPLSFNPEAFAPPAKPDPDATLLDTPPTPRATVTLPPSAPPPKSKAPLYAGLAAGVFALAGAAFVFWPKEEKLTKAELYARQQEAERAAAKPEPGGILPSALPASAGDQEAEARKLAATTGSAWQPLRAPAEWQALRSDKIEFRDGLLHLREAGIYTKQTSLNGAIRTRIQVRADSLNFGVIGRTQGKGDQYKLSVTPNGAVLLSRSDATRKTLSLASHLPPTRPAPGEFVTLELRIHDNQLTGLLNGVVVVEAQDDHIRGVGGWGIFAGAGAYESAEFQLAEATSPTPAPDAPAAEPWQDVLRDPGMLQLSPGVERTPEGLNFAQSGTAVLHSRFKNEKDGAIRVRSVFGEGGRIQPTVRFGGRGSYSIYAQDAQTVRLLIWDEARRSSSTLALFPTPQPLITGQDYELELRVVGPTLTAKLNGQLLGTVEDTTLPFGRVMLTNLVGDGASALVKSLEFLDLDAPAVAKVPSGQPGAEPLKLVTTAASAAPQWQVFDFATMDEATFRASDTAAEKQGPYLHSMNYRGWAAPAASMQNVAARATVHVTEERSDARLIARFNHARVYPYLRVFRTVAEMCAQRPGREEVLKTIKLPQPLQPGADVTMKIAVIGDRMQAWVNGQDLGTVEIGDLRHPGATHLSGQDALFKNLEILNLDGLPEAEALKIASGSVSAGVSQSSGAATKDAPFVNSLGMKFVPVPITYSPERPRPPLVPGGAASAGRPPERVLFSIWETRVQDYEDFATERKRDWPKPAFVQSSAHPAVMVSWDDAQAFCAWLTARERQAGRIGAGEVYRLPTDHEWSCAVGIGDREDAAQRPVAKDGKLADIFAWGSVWPPLPGTGNFNSSASSDDSPVTARVGLFAASPTGLYDLAGNVWEGCEDEGYQSGERIMRGGCYTDGQVGNLLASRRISRAQSYRIHTTGFRVVLAPVP